MSFVSPVVSGHLIYYAQPATRNKRIGQLVSHIKIIINRSCRTANRFVPFPSFSAVAVQLLYRERTTDWNANFRQLLLFRQFSFCFEREREREIKKSRTCVLNDAQPTLHFAAAFDQKCIKKRGEMD